MRKYLLMQVMCLLAFVGFAQSDVFTKRNPYNYLFRLDSAQVEMINQRGIFDTAWFFTHKIDSFMNQIPVLKPGYYLQAKAVDRGISSYIYYVPFVQIRITAFNDQVQVRLFDSLWNSRHADRFYIQGKLEKFDTSCGCYSFNRSKKPRSFFIRFGDNFASGTISGDYKSYPPEPRTVTGSTPAISLGYFLINQPRYHVKDTVKMKAYILKPDGHAFTKNLLLYLKENFSPYRRILLAEVKPASRGAYVYNYAIPDTFKTDRSYHLSFEGKDGSVLKETDFYTEDYKLRNASYSATMDKALFRLAEPIIIHLKATDANELPLTNARARVRVFITDYSDIKEREIFIPNAWYQSFYETSQELEISGPTEVQIPQAIFPLMNMNLVAEVSFSDPSGELSVQRVSFSRRADSTYQSFTNNRDFIQLHFYELGIESHRKFIVKGYLNERVMSIDTVVSPWQQYSKPNCNSYLLCDSAGRVLESLNIVSTQAPLWVDGIRTHDSIHIVLENPAGYEIYYQLYRNKREIKRGLAKDFSYHVSDTTPFSYNLIYIYTRRGQTLLQERIFTFRDKELEVKCNMPSQVFPGQTVPMDIQVFNADRKPQPYVNLTAYGVNAQFENITVPYLPYYGSEDEKVLLQDRTDIMVKPGTGYSNYMQLASYHTLLASGFINQNDYRLRYPNEKVFEARIPLAYAGIEFTPFVMANGRKLGIYCIEIDSEPVYIQPQNGDQTNFSFRISAGRHLISVRTQTAWYHIPRNFTSDSSHYVFSFDTLCMPEGIVKVKSGSITGFTEDEFSKIKEHFLVLEPRVLERYSRGFIVQKNKVLCVNKSPIWTPQRNGEKRYLFLGPLPFGTSEILFENQPADTIQFLPGKQYTYYREAWQTEDQDTFELPYELKFFRYYTEDLNAIYDTLAQTPIQQNVVAEQNTLKNESYDLDILDEKCIMTDAYEPELITNTQARIQIQGVPAEKVYGIYFIHKKREENSVLKHFNQGVAVTYLYFLDTGVYDMFILLRNGKLFHRYSLQIQPAGLLVLTLQPEDFKENCDLLFPYKTLARKLKDDADFRNRQLISYRAGDYVQVRNKPELQYTVSKYSGGQIAGSIVNLVGSALENVVVTLERNGKITGVSFTDVSGGFLLRNVPAATYDLRLTRYGSCITVLRDIPVKNRQVLSINIRLGNCGFSSDDVSPTPVLYDATRRIRQETIEEYRESKEPIQSGTGILRGKVVDAANRRPVDFVSLILKKRGVTVYSCLTDDDGEYIMKNLPPGEYTLHASFIGFNSVIIDQIEINEDEDRFLNFSMTANANRQLNEVVVAYKREMVEPGGVKGSVRSEEVLRMGTRSVNSLASSYSGIDPDFRGARADGTAYYIDGVRVSNAAVSNMPADAISVNVAGMPASFADMQKKRMMQMAGNDEVKEERKEFRDYSFWVPNMVTNSFGEAHVSVTFPDNITRWRNFIIAMDEELNTAVHAFDVKSFKPLSAQLYVPDFMLRSDELTMRGRIINYTGDTLALKTRFMWNNVTTDSQEVSCGASKVLHHKVKAAENDTITAGFSLETNFNYRDGEKYLVPVLDNRIEKTIYESFVLKGDTAVSFTTDSLSEHSLTMLSTRIQLMKMMIKQLQNYHYGCVEQTTSKLNALLISQKLCRMVKDTFRDQDLIRFCVKRLETQQQSNGMWGWYGRSYQEMWLTHYVMQTLISAQKAGYGSKAFKHCEKYLLDHYMKMNDHDKILALDILFESRREIDFKAALEPVNEEALALADRVILTRLKQKLNLPHFSGFVFRGIQKDKDGKVYWNNAGQGIYYSRLMMNYQVYEMLKAEQTDSSLLAGLRKYVFEDAVFGSNTFLNTLENSRILSAMIADDASLKKELTFCKVKVNDKLVQQEFPVEMKLQKNTTYKIGHEGSEVRMFVKHKKMDANPLPDSSWFTIHTYFEQDKQLAQNLRNSLPVTYWVNIRTARPTEFVMIQVPIPAGFVYSKKNETFGADEVEYHKDRLILYYRVWYGGQRTIKLELEPRFAGNLTLLPVTVENMYDPLISGNNKVRKLIVTE